MRLWVGGVVVAAAAIAAIVVIVPLPDTANAQSKLAAAPPLGEFAGGVVFYGSDGVIRQTQYARLSVTTVRPITTGASVRWNFGVVPWSSSSVCVHHLTSTRAVRKDLEYAFRVSSMTGSCIPNARSYRISSLDRGRVVVELTYGDGLTASGLLRRRVR